jgi:class 3 adenylate cyclase/predicted ATPase
VDIAAWLYSLGMQQYEEAFRDNAIDPAVLTDLTADDLKDLGVSLVGHRRKLLAAIAALRTDVGPVPEAAAAGPAAERRQLTVMFCDLVGSTALSARVDPEDLRGIIGAYHRCVAEIVEGFGGFVARYMGDGVLVYFGYPQAHEDDAERATRCGLALVDRVPKLNQAEKLHARVGIATGLVVVGGEVVEHDVVGDTPNLAARLQALAEPDTVVVAASTRRLTGDLFEYRDLGEIELKGIAGRVPAWQALRPSAVESRFEALRARGLTPLVGRGEEIELLLRRWHRARGGEGQAVLLSGEPGIGKSRLAAALQEHLADQPHARLRYFCSLQHQDSPLHPFIAQLERAARFARDDSVAARLDKLETLLTPNNADSAEMTGLIADLLGLVSEGRYPLLPHDPRRKREMTLSALLGQLERLARQKPVLMIFEDAHWADSSSLELLDRTVDRVTQLPVLLVISFRPEFQPAWLGQAHVSLLTLSRLAQRDTAALATAVTAGKSLPREILDLIIERTDGIPLFIEELTKSVIEGGPLHETDNAFVLGGPLPPVAIPSSLQASLMERLDRLAPVREVAQIAAAIGREFSYELLAAVARRADADLHDALNRLAEAGLVFRRGIPPRSSYLFKHALVQDAAYSTLLHSRRRELHGRIALVISERFPEVSENQPEILAHHLSNAGQPLEALEFWNKAARIARGRSAFAEATALLRRGLELIPSLPEAARAEHEVRFQMALGQVYQAMRGYGSPEAEAAFDRASQLCEARTDSSELMPVLIGLRAVNQVQGRSRRARDHAVRCLGIAETLGDRFFAVLAHASLGHTLSIMGRFSEARESLATAVAEYRPGDFARSTLAFGIEPKVIALTTAGWNEWFLGYPDSALAAALGAIALARELGHPQTLDQALNNAPYTHLLRREPNAALGDIEGGLALAREHGFTMRIGQLRVLEGWVGLLKGDSEQAVRKISGGMSRYEATGARTWRTFRLALLAESYRKAKRIDEGLSALSEARETGVAQDEYWWDAELWRLQGDLLLDSPHREAEQIEGCYSAALETARRQQAKGWELRAATSLARLRRDQGRRAEGRDLLAPVYTWFTEGFGTPDLKDAKALLDELGGG